MIALSVFIEIYMDDLHLHHTVAYLSQQPVNPIDRRIVEILIPQHISAAGHSDIRRPSVGAGIKKSGIFNANAI